MTYALDDSEFYVITAVVFGFLAVFFEVSKGNKPNAFAIAFVLGCVHARVLSFQLYIFTQAYVRRTQSCLEDEK